MKNLINQESAGVFGITAGGILWAWNQGAPTSVLWMLTSLGLAFIVTEKVRAMVRPRKP